MSVLIADWKKYICRACGVIYDEELGTPIAASRPVHASTRSPMTGSARYAG